jgi:hypothetical protein
MSFRDYSNYTIGKFDVLENIITDFAKQDMYCQKWLKSYSETMKNYDGKMMIEWEIRLWRAIKELFAASIFFNNSNYALEYKCTSSFYFLQYYSLFHGMLSCLCLDTNVGFQQLKDINHSKVLNNFYSSYCNGKFGIVDKIIKDVFMKAKYLREYFSYTPPLNMDLYEAGYKEKIEELLVQCFQLTNLQSLILEKCFQKYGKIFKISNPEDGYYLREQFMTLIARKNPLTNRYEVDPADKNFLYEMERDGVAFQFIALQLDHIYDEFRTYNSNFYKGSQIINSQSIYNFIYDAII